MSRCWCRILLAVLTPIVVVGCGGANEAGLYASPGGPSVPGAASLSGNAPGAPGVEEESTGMLLPPDPDRPGSESPVEPSASMNDEPAVEPVDGSADPDAPPAPPASQGGASAPVAGEDDGAAGQGEQVDEAPVAEGSAGLVTLTIDRARYKEDDGELEVRGEVSDPGVSLSVEFGGRVEPLDNDDGEFRDEFSDVEDAPATLTVRASDGSSVTVAVEVD